MPNTRKISPSRAYIQRIQHRAIKIISSEGSLSCTYGALPEQMPLLNLPPAYHLWDKMAQFIPEYIANGTIIKEIEAMAVLDAGEDSLDEQYLSRASVILSALAHAYKFHQRRDVPEQALLAMPFPPAIDIPWREICRRLGRANMSRTATDDFLNNWKLIDPTRKRTFDNIELLVPYTHVAADNIMYKVVIAMEAAFGKAYGYIIEAQDAVHNEDNDLLEISFHRLVKIIRKLIYIFSKLDPRKHNNNYVDPILWSRTFATIGKKTIEGELGNTGADSMIFHVLDAFFSRRSFHTLAGEEMQERYGRMPRTHKEFIDSLMETSVVDYILQSQNPKLKGLIALARNLYVGPDGLLDNHRKKIFANINLAIEDGRTQTNNDRHPQIEGCPAKTVTTRSSHSQGPTCPYAAQASSSIVFTSLPLSHTPLTTMKHNISSITPTAVIHINRKLETAIAERKAEFYQGWQSVRKVHHSIGEPSIVSLDISQTAVYFNPGDKCEIFSENSDEMVNNVLELLNEDGGRPIVLNKTWRETLNYLGYQVSFYISLFKFLKIVDMHNINKNLIDMINDSTNNVLNLSVDNLNYYDLFYLLSEIRSSLNMEEYKNDHILCGHSPYYITSMLYPIGVRQYSIAQVVGDSINILLSRVLYRSILNQSHILRGNISNSLIDANEGSEFKIRFIYNPHFSIAPKQKHPIIIFATGTGISPFITAINDGRYLHNNKSMVFFGAGNFGFPYMRDLLLSARFNRYKLFLALSKSKKLLTYDPGKRALIDYMPSPDDSCHVNRFLDDISCLLRIEKLLRYHKAKIYVCGREELAFAVKSMLKNMFSDNDSYFDILSNRYHEEVFNSQIEPRFITKKITHQDLFKHNDESHGYWIVIENKVYDISDYLHEHPGGHKILGLYAGLDATCAYNICHKNSQMINGMLNKMYVGQLSSLNIKNKKVKILYAKISMLTEYIVKLQNKLLSQIDVDDLTPITIKISTYKNEFTPLIKKIKDSFVVFLETSIYSKASDFMVVIDHFMSDRFISNYIKIKESHFLISKNEIKRIESIFNDFICFILRIKNDLINFIDILEEESCWHYIESEAKICCEKIYNHLLTLYEAVINERDFHLNSLSNDSSSNEFKYLTSQYGSYFQPRGSVSICTSSDSSDINLSHSMSLPLG